MATAETFEKHSVLPIEKFPFLVVARNAIMLQHFFYPISALLSIQTFALKLVVVAYKRFRNLKNWSLKRSDVVALLREVVATGYKPEVRLYFQILSKSDLLEIKQSICKA